MILHWFLVYWMFLVMFFVFGVILLDSVVRISGETVGVLAA